MDLSYKNLEEEYYKALRDIVRSLDIKMKSTSCIKLPYLLENTTLPKLQPQKCWIISGISGVGKTTILKQLTSAGFIKIPNITTRLKRSEEKNEENMFIDNSRFLLLKRLNLLFHPHKRNSVWQALLKKDVKKLIKGDTFLYLDKSVAASITLKKTLPKKVNFTFIYLLPSTFKELYARILKRESLRGKSEKRLKRKEILKRFKEEIDDMKKSTKLPYIYIVNDSLKRVEKILSNTIRDSRNI